MELKEAFEEASFIMLITKVVSGKIVLQLQSMIIQSHFT